MEVKLSPEVADRLARAAERRGISPELLAHEAIERAVDHDEWFVREVEKGLAQVEAGQVLSHEVVGTRLEQKPTERPATRTADTAHLSERSLAVDWDRPEEDDAWEHLQNRK